MCYRLVVAYCRLTLGWHCSLGWWPSNNLLCLWVFAKCAVVQSTYFLHTSLCEESGIRPEDDFYLLFTAYSAQGLPLGRLSEHKTNLCHSGVRALEQAPARNRMLLQTSYNNLAVALLDHGKNVQALEFLLKAEALFINQQPGRPPVTADAVQAAELLQHLSLKGYESEGQGQPDAVMEEGDAGGASISLPTHVIMSAALRTPSCLARTRTVGRWRCR